MREALLGELEWAFALIPAAHVVFFRRVSHKSQKISAWIEPHRGQELDAHYLGFFDCFNRQLYFEAHEVLEELWLAQRGKIDDLFYKGLIQLAGAFVHLQKRRTRPAIALFKLAGYNLGKYPGCYQRLDITELAQLIRNWILLLEAEPEPPAAFQPRLWPILALTHVSV